MQDFAVGFSTHLSHFSKIVESLHYHPSIAVAVMKGLNAIGLLRSWAPMPTESVAAAMIRLAQSGRQGIEIVKSQGILRV